MLSISVISLSVDLRSSRPKKLCINTQRDEAAGKRVADSQRVRAVHSTKIMKRTCSRPVHAARNLRSVSSAPSDSLACAIPWSAFVNRGVCRAE